MPRRVVDGAHPVPDFPCCRERFIGLPRDNMESPAPGGTDISLQVRPFCAWALFNRLQRVVFAQPSDVLKAGEGNLSDTPFPLLLHSLFQEERTCALELKLRQLEKRVSFEDGVPVACSSNLLHETLGKYLVEKGKLSEHDYQQALAESVQSGQQMGELLVKKGLFAPFDLFKQLQANLAHKILDCFRWSEGQYRILLDVAPPTNPVRMNVAQLVMTGVSTVMPFDAVATQLAFVDEQRFALVPKPPHEVSGLKLAPKEAKLLQLLRGRPTFAELAKGTGLETEPLLRRMYAFAALGILGFADSIPQAPNVVEPAPVLAPVPVAEVVKASIAYADEDEGLRNALASAFLENRSKDPFALLGVAEDAPPLALRKAFLGLADQFSPVRFRSADLREKAESVLIAAARAYSTLADPEQLALWKRRRAAAAEKEKAAASRPSTVEQFRIRTDLLDANSQFTEGKRRLAEGNYRGALEYFEYACDIDPRALYLAYRGWARYQVSPRAHEKLALQELQAATRKDINCDEAYFLLGELYRAIGNAAEAEDAYRRAFKANPRERRYADLIQQMMKQSKVAR